MDNIFYFDSPDGRLCASDREIDRTAYQNQGVPCYTPSEVAIIKTQTAINRSFSYKIKQVFGGDTVIVPMTELPGPSVVVVEEEVVPF